MKRNKDRLGIFVFYDVNNVLNDYVFFLLKSIKELVNKLVVVINGGNKQETMEKLYCFTSYLYIRENIGYDGGAYKDTFLIFLADEKWECWDEVILFNDTFYGPFFSWGHIFEKFENIDVDFWGLSRWVQGEEKNWGCEIAEHVQGYFIVIRKRMVLSPYFMEFWRQLQYPLTYQRAVINFEAEFTKFFSQKGFLFKTWLDLVGGNVLLHKGEVVYLKHADLLVSQYDFPIIKRKVFSITNFSKVYNALKYIENNYCFDTDLIWKHLKYLDRVREFKPFSFNKMEEFYNNHKNIYIYGYGKWGHEIEKYFEYQKWNVEKFVVSEQECKSDKVIKFSELDLESNDGLILALGRKALGEVYPVISQKYKRGQLLLPEF